MPTFIESCNCKGTRPIGIVGSRHTSRPDIIGSLLKDRRVSRFIVAPSGFGKSTIAYEYANIIFSFEHVFWIRCDSPCFLRDLDAGKLYSDLVSCDPSVALVVCEDLPSMDYDRRMLMNGFINQLLDRECEVLITCTPSCDAFSNLQIDRMVVGAKDLMLTEGEMTIEELHGGVSINWKEEIKPPARVPCNIWGDGGTHALLTGLRSEDLPQEMKLAIMLLLIRGSGVLDCLSRFLPKDHIEEIVATLEAGYPMLGIESRTKSFSAIDVDVHAIAAGFCSKIDDFVIASLFSERDKLCFAISDWLCEESQFEKACDVMESFATKFESAKWLAQKGWKMLVNMSALSCVKLHDVSRRGATGYYNALSSIKAWGSFILDDEERAAKFARRLMRSSGARAEERISGALLLCLLHDDHRSEAEEIVREVAAQSVHGVDALSVYDMIDWRSCARFAVSEHSQRLDSIIHSAGAAKDAAFDLEEGKSRNAFMLCATLLLDDISMRISGVDPAARSAMIEEALALSKAVVNIMARSDVRLQLFEMLFLGRVETLEQFIPTISSLVDRPDFGVQIRKHKVHICAQAEEYKKHLVIEMESKLEFQRANPDVFRKNEAKPTEAAANHMVPMLYVTLFGGLQARIGDEPIASRLLGRQKTKLLLALLVLNKGHEVSKAQILNTLWPNGDMDTYKRNFYSVWSQLKKALSINGSCPYLIRTQTGCRLDGKYLRSDLVKFDELCRILLFGSDASVAWEVLYEQVNEEFSEDLLPAMTGNDQIDLMREKCRENLIDGLIAASSRLNSQGEPRGALWFAREAIRRNDKREDAYIALMEAQISANQRGSALETYFSCRRFLSEELGIDPSIRVIELYRSIIECEEELV